jgi:hyperosmotically inducible protein
MIRTLFALLIVGVIAAYLLGYWRPFDHNVAPVAATRSTGERGGGPVDPAVARERGAEAGERAAAVVNRTAEVLSDSALTAKIKSKMALDDSVRARNIDVTTTDGDVRLRGLVASEAERERALRLARETAGVKSVTDELRIESRR